MCCFDFVTKYTCKGSPGPLSLLSGSDRSQAAKRILMHFELETECSYVALLLKAPKFKNDANK